MKYQTLIIYLTAYPLGITHAAITQFTDRPAFLAALPPGYLSTDFSSLAAGDVGTTTATIFGSQPGATLLLEARDSSNAFPGNNLWVPDTGDLAKAIGTTTTFSDILRISSTGGFFVIGADWFLGDIDDNYLAGTVNLTFSDASTYSITSTSQANSFRGFISDSPLTSLLIAPSDPANVAGWVTIDQHRRSRPLCDSQQPGPRLTIPCDSGLKYESKIYNQEWLFDNEFDTDLPLESVVG